MLIKTQGSPIVLSLKALAKDQYLSKAAWSEFKDFCNRISENNGDIALIKVMKDINTRARHMVAGYPKGDNLFGGVIWLKVDKSTRLPKALKRLKEFLLIEPNVALLITNIVYLYTIPVDQDLNSIESIGTFKGIRYQSRFKRWLGSNAPRLRPSDVNIHITCKGGPNGPSAVSQAQDMACLLQSNIPYLEYVDSIYGPDSWLKDLFNNFSNEVITNPEPLRWKKDQPPIMAKLVFLQAPAGKTRVVYVLNWWIQQLLLPLHDSMMNHFKDETMLQNDATWDQERAVETIRRWSKEGRKLSSFDLTAATDRWPALHQNMVISACFGNKVSSAWLFCMTRIPPFVKSLGKHIFYSVGQPMGAYSSWASLNLSHHLLIRWLCDELNEPRDYMVLGDDVVIANPKVARAYKLYIKSLGVSINDMKSIICEEGKPSSAEFARHVIRDGQTVGTLSPKLLDEIYNKHNWPMAIELIREIRSKLGLEIIVSPHGTLVPLPLDNLLTSLLGNYKDRLIAVWTVPIEGLKLPITKVEDISSFNSNYIKYDNPWTGKDPAGIQAIFTTKWRRQAEARLNELNELHTALSTGTLRQVGGLYLNCKSHPTQLLVSRLGEELMNQFWVLESVGSKPFRPKTLIETSIDLLISVLSKGLTYRQWRDSKSVKLYAMGKFISTALKDCPDKQPEPVVSYQNWQDYASAWESLEIKS